MSRRESCVWHPMPDEVRRSSVQSRRASLAAGRRKNTKDEPDWEVEAPPTPPNEDYSPRQDVPRNEPIEEDKTNEPVEAATAEERAAEPVKEEEEEEPVQEEPAKEEEPVQEEPAKEEEPVQEEKQEEPVQEEEPAKEEVPETTAVAKEVMKGKTRHTVRFRGDSWGNLKDQDALEEAFKKDVYDAAKVKPEEINSLNFRVQADCMIAEFIMYHPKKDKSRMATVHEALQNYDFNNVCNLYP